MSEPLNYTPDLICVTATYDTTVADALSIEVRLNITGMALGDVTELIRVLREHEPPAPHQSITGGHASPNGISRY